MLVICIKQIYFWKPFVKENLLFKTMFIFSVQELELVVFTFENGPVPRSNSSRVLYWNGSGSSDSSRLPRPFTFIRQSQPPYSSLRYHLSPYNHKALTGFVTWNQDASASCSAQSDPRPDQTRRPQSSSGVNHHPSHTGNNYCI